MMLADMAPRYAAFALLAVLILALAWKARRSWTGRLAILLSVSLVAELVCSSPFMRAMTGSPMALEAGCVALPALFWLTALSLFSPRFRPHPLHFLPLLAVEAVHFGARGAPWGPAVQIALILAICLHVLWLAGRGLRTDPLAARRRLRIYVLAALPVLGSAWLIATRIVEGLPFFDRMMMTPIVGSATGMAVAILFLAAAGLAWRWGWRELLHPAQPSTIDDAAPALHSSSIGKTGEGPS